MIEAKQSARPGDQIKAVDAVGTHGPGKKAEITVVGQEVKDRVSATLALIASRDRGATRIEGRIPACAIYLTTFIIHASPRWSRVTVTALFRSRDTDVKEVGRLVLPSRSTFPSIPTSGLSDCGGSLRSLPL